MALKTEFHAEYSKFPATKFRALEIGSVYYFTGKRCKKNHLSLRYASSGNCSECISTSKGKASINFKGRSSKRDEENQKLAMMACESGFTTYVPHSSCRNGHFLRYVTSNNCVECNNDALKKRSLYLKWKRIEKEYGISKTQFEDMVKLQNGKCSICKCSLSEKNSHIDHCHKTGKVRSILCSKCNQGIGLFNEDERLITEAAKYVRRFKNET